MHQMNSVLCGQLCQVGAAIRDELLIRRHDGFSRSQSLANPAFYGVQPTHQLDDNICIRTKNNIDIIGPYDRCRHGFSGWRVTLTVNVAVEDMRQLHARKLRRGKNTCDRAAHCSKSKYRNLYNRICLRLLHCSLLFISLSLRGDVLVVDSAGVGAPCIKA